MLCGATDTIDQIKPKWREILHGRAEVDLLSRTSSNPQTEIRTPFTPNQDRNLTPLN